MKQFLLKLWQDEEGAETAEWLVIAALITVVGTAVYPGVLQPALTGLVGSISGMVTSAGVPAPTP
jgi:Flp pilus assembly pilin Flp